ncbi:hypothetical protein AB205_0018650 [Aquarana catesbeiana]|uniref:G-protein coupled receptors family 1 profile domain-containing protein n=1 Tax=Aquarana catesbeiana TaxID=8400 RepID=A0A2G9R8R3_AQUCT|nr:hypothetical protein AB205_0018650 [Aquarana catesbeiana]
MVNQTILNELFLSGLSDLPGLHLPLFFFFLLIYLLTLFWNFLIIVLIVTNSHLHVPMYFFLGNLAGLDLCYSSLTVPPVLKIQAKGNRSKVFSTCVSHLTVMFMYYGSVMFNYFLPSTRHQFSGDKAVAVFYTVILPLLNPLIYSLRNQDFRTAFQSVFRKISPPKLEIQRYEYKRKGL